jgi:decaprenylphospho-beta-D-erythro-pentofuranosid-2-ulose 2-reductase
MKAVILGATSAIAHELSRIYAAEGATLFLVARNAAKLEGVANDLRVRGATVETLVADLADRSRDEEIVHRAGTGIDVVLLAHGVYPEQRAVDRDARAQAENFDVNATSFIALAAHFANVLETAKQGTLAVIGSVAGDRGRRTNYTYGSAKAAVHAYCEGLRARLRESNVAVVLLKPGWIDTPMTAAMKKNPMFVSAAAAAKGIHRAIEKKRAVAYVPGFWRWIALVLKLLPSRLIRF